MPFASDAQSQYRFTGERAIFMIALLNLPDSTNALSTASYTYFASVFGYPE